MTDKPKKMWSGRFSEETNSLMEVFSRSVELDKRMWRDDIAGNRAWAEALMNAGIFTAQEFEQVDSALQVIAKEFAQERFQFELADEDIHMAVERRLTELTGAIGARIHSGRSRNDQVMTDAQLYLKRAVGEWVSALTELQQVLLNTAKLNEDAILPGYTHWQQAQPILLSHYLLAVFWGIYTTVDRLNDYYARLDILPLGSGALAGSGIPVNRKALAKRLNFAKISPNSLYATGSREVFAELLFICGGFFTHISRVSAELQIWNTNEFGFVTFSDAFTTGSSMMPQKKNPDSLELLRGRSAAAISAANQLQILQRGLPMTYNRDLQEDKRVTFEQLDSAILCTKVLAGTIEGASFNEERMIEACDSLLLATDLADYLVRRGTPFRHAHDIVGNIVAEAIRRDCALEDLSLEDLNGFSDQFEKDVYTALDLRKSLQNRNIDGGTGPKAVQRQIRLAEKAVARMKKHPFLARKNGEQRI
ncbi:MAG: argininosuccinate lyase [Calditrichia bacterium]